MCSCRNVHPFRLPSQPCNSFAASCSLINIWYISVWSIKMFISHITKFTYLWKCWMFLEYVILLIIPVWIFWETEKLISIHKHWHPTVPICFTFNTEPFRNVLFSTLHKCAAVRDASLKCQTNFTLYFIIYLANLLFVMYPCTYSIKILLYGN